MIATQATTEFDPRRFGTCDSNRLDFARATFEVIRQLAESDPVANAKKIQNLCIRMQHTI